MSGRLFEDLLSESEIESAKKELYNPYVTNQDLSENVKMTSEGLDELLSRAKRCLASSKQASDYYKTSTAKEEFDKIMVLIERFIPQFKKMYEQSVAIEVAEKLFESENQTSNKQLGSSGQITVGGNLSVSSGGLTVNGTTTIQSGQWTHTHNPIYVTGTSSTGTLSTNPGVNGHISSNGVQKLDSLPQKRKFGWFKKKNKKKEKGQLW